MSKLNITRTQIDAARDRSALTHEELRAVNTTLGDAKGSIAVELGNLPPTVVRALLDDPKLKPNQRAVVALQVHGMSGGAGAGGVPRDAIYPLAVSNAVEFGSTLAALGSAAPNAEMQLNGRWYPIALRVEFQENEEKLAKRVVLSAVLCFGHTVQQLSWYVGAGLFNDAEGQPRELTVLDVLRKLGFRGVQTPPAEYNLKLVRCERIAQDVGLQVVVRNSVVEPAPRAWWSRPLRVQPLGTNETPRRAVVDPDWELDDDGHGHPYSLAHRSADAGSHMPFVRVFSLDLKTFVYADVDDVEPYEYDERALGRLHLPERMLGVLTRVFQTPQDQLFGDLIRGKHGGVVILASGNPGVGKTLTAEVYAEMTRRTLYVLEFGELGAALAQVETSLRGVFARVVRWNAVLQFDECEVFLEQRGGDLERSAIVGVFLRLLDYYDGLLFLTTNRPQALDHAILSRVMLRLEYPDLDAAARATIWRTMFDAAGLHLTGGTFEDLADSDVNGRQIRNLSRLARVLHPDGNVTLAQMRDVLTFGCR
jgi:hypothetical protein